MIVVQGKMWFRVICEGFKRDRGYWTMNSRG